MTAPGTTGTGATRPLGRRRLYRLRAAALPLIAATLLGAATQSSDRTSRPGPTVRITAHANGGVPAQFEGFSIEPANVCYVVSLARSDPAFVQLFRNLGAGTLRVGGGTGDKFASWSSTGPGTCFWKGDAVTPSVVDSLFSFATTAGYRVIWQVPLRNQHLSEDAAEAAYVASKPGLYSVEFGNEPNLYPDAPTEYQTYIDEWNAVYKAYRTDGGTAPVSGPGVANISEEPYLSTFLAQDASKLRFVSAHYYVGSATGKNCGGGGSPCVPSTCERLLSLDSDQIDTLTDYVVQARSYKLPFVLGETNTFTQGKRGVSNAYCSALWTADYMLTGLAHGLEGMYFHGTADYPPGNVGGLPQFYTPINDNGTPAPEYYGLLFFHEMTKAGGTLVDVTTTKSPGLDAWAVQGTDGELRVALVNRTGAPRTITVQTAQSYTQADQITLTAPGLHSLTGTTFGGASVANDGTWTPSPQPLPVDGTTLSVRVPSYAGMAITYSNPS